MNFMLTILSVCTSFEEFKVRHQVTGGIETNCYLIYGIKSKEAALIDVGGSIDSLISYIKSNNLELKYLLCTHGHFDHVIGIPYVKELFPKAKIVLHKSDYVDMFTQKKWAENNLGPDFIDYLMSDPERRKIYDFDVSSFGEPDIFVEDNQILPLGNSNIKVYHTPGHSPGSVCYQIKNILFSGDLIFYRSVGRTDVQNGSRDDIIRSIRRIYDFFPDNIIVYPGHDEFTDLDSEKKANKYVSQKGGEWVQ